MSVGGRGWAPRHLPRRGGAPTVRLRGPQSGGSDEDVAGLRPVRGLDDAVLLELIHGMTGAGEPDAELPLQHRRAAELRRDDLLRRERELRVVLAEVGLRLAKHWALQCDSHALDARR